MENTALKCRQILDFRAPDVSVCKGCTKFISGGLCALFLATSWAQPYP